MIVAALVATSPVDRVAARGGARALSAADAAEAVEAVEAAADQSADDVSNGSSPVAAASGPGGVAAASAAASASGVPAAVGTGTSVSGVDCASGKRQLATSAYGAACQAASNIKGPGATARGITNDTINVTLRISEGGQSAALLATAGTAADSLGADQQSVAADMRTLVAYFNRVYDLYGRHVELKVYNGQGDFLAEFQNQNIQGAQADGARARDLDAFADVSIVTMTQPYSEALVSQQIIAMSPVYLSERWHRAHAPYAFGVVTPIGTRVGSFMGNVACRRLASGNAAFAGDSAMHGKPRAFGIIHPENPEFALIGDVIDRALRSCGHAPARRIAYALNIATAQNEHTNAVAQMKAAGVTTLMCVCDEFSPIFLTRAADQQHYAPEWMQIWWPDPWQRLANSSQWSHSMHTGGTSPDFLAGEIGATWRAAAGGAQPRAAAALHFVYPQLLSLFSALQAAGPNLTPVTFQRGWFSLPSTAAGDLGPWTFGPGVFNPKTQFQLGWYDPAFRSNFDGQAGAIRSCEGGRWFRFDDAGGIGAGPIRWFRAMTFGEWIRRYAGLLVVIVLLVIVVLLAPTTAR